MAGHGRILVHLTMAKTLARLQLEDPAATRLLDDLIARLNPTLRALGSVAVANSSASTVADLRADFNALLAALRTAGVIR